MHLSSTLALAALAGSSLAATVGRRANLPREEECTSTEVVTVTSTVTASGSPTGAPKPPNAAVTPESSPEEANYAETPAREDPASGDDSNSGSDYSNSNSNSNSTSGGDSAETLDTKRGFAYNDADAVNSIIKGGADGSWAYNWDSNDNGLDSSVEFVPMLWSNDDDHVSRWESNVEEMLGKGAKCLLSFNEPDHHEQAKMDPVDAAAAHAKYMNPYGDKARIGAPAVTNSQEGGEGIEWLEKFIPACEDEGCQIDFCNAHWYGPADDLDSLKTHLEEVRDACKGKPVWLTEFAPEGKGEAAVGFIGKALHLMDEDLAFVERYSYFMVGGPQGRLTEGDSLSAEGQAYFEGN